MLIANVVFHRILYGASKAICEHIESGDKYEKIIKVISVNILYFDLGQCSDYIYKGFTEFKGMHAADILQLSQDQQNTFNKLYPKEIFLGKAKKPKSQKPIFFLVE